MLQGLAKHTKVKDLLDKTVELTGSHQQTSTDSTITIQNHLKKNCLGNIRGSCNAVVDKYLAVDAILY